MPAPADFQEKAANRFRFGLFEADAGTGELRKSGTRIRLQAQPFRLLICLLERPGEVVSREEIQQRLWGSDTIVDFDHSLGTAINKLREALGDSADNPRFVETLARRGYRFIAPVTATASPAAEQPPQPLPQPVTAEIPPGEPAQELPTSGFRSRALPLTLAILAATITATAGFVAGLWLGPVRTVPRHISQVTFSGRVSPGDPLFESFPGTATDGTRIYFPQIENGRSVLAQALIADGETSILPLPGELAAPSLGDISPDGSRLLLRNHLATGPEQALWIVSTTGGTARTIPGVQAHDATWMPDGQRVLYATGSDLYICNDDGTGRRKLATLPGRAFWLRWSPDGRRLRLTLLNSETHLSDLWEIASDGSGAHELLGRWNSSPGSECCGSWSDDGHYFVFQSHRNGENNIWALRDHSGLFGGAGTPFPVTSGPLDYQAPITERGGHRTFFIGLNTQTDLLRYDSSGHIFVPWGPVLSNARRVAFTRDGQWVAWIRQDDGSFWRSRADGSERLQLTGRPMQVFMMHWSPDGHRLVLMGRQPGEPWSIYTLDADGGHLQRVLDEKRSEADPGWSPDGKTLVFGRLPDLMAEASQPKAIYLVDLATKAVTRLPGSEGLFSPRWSADGRYIAALTIDQKKLMLYDWSTRSWRLLAEQNIADPDWSHDGSAIYFHDFAEPDQPIFRVTLATGHIDRMADLRNLRSANVIDYRFAGLAPGDVPLVSARESAANIYATALPK